MYIEMKNKFDSKASIIGGVIFYGIFTFIGLLMLVELLTLNEKYFDDIIENYISNGKGINIKTRTIVNIIYSYFGRKGCIIFLVFGNLILSYTLYKEIYTLRRYLHKEKLYKMGLVSNMDDDYKPVGLIKSIKQFFKKSGNTATSTVKYSRKDLRKMKKKLKDMENKRKR